MTNIATLVENRLAEISKKVWIVKGQGLVKKVPVVRIDIEKPAFYNMGVDYFAPIVKKQYRKTRSTT